MTLIENVSWSTFSQEIPLVAVVGFVSEDMTIYACLQQAVKIFDTVLVCGDGVTPQAMKMFERFCVDHEDVAKNKVYFIDVEKLDPWPWLSFVQYVNDPKDVLIKQDKVGKVFQKTCSKATAKRHAIARAMFPNAMLFSLHADVVLFNDTRERVKSRIAKIENPLFDSEWFCLVNCLDQKHITKIIGQGLSQRMIHDYPGDWGFMCHYASSCLTVGPDPIAPQASCLYPWSEKTQCSKKGHDVDVPYGIHFEPWRDAFDGLNFEEYLKTAQRIDELKDIDPELYAKFADLDWENKLYFPKKFIIQDDYTTKIVSNEL